MGIQDDIFDVQEKLSGEPEQNAFERICDFIARLETREDEAREKLDYITKGLAVLKELINDSNN